MFPNALPYIERNRKNFWIVLGIYISIFVSSYVFFTQPFEFYFGYLIYLLLLPGFVYKFGFNRSLFYIFLILFVVGLIGIMAGNNTASQFFKVFGGVFLSYVFYTYVILELECDVEQLFKWYMIGAYIAAIIGIVQLISFQLNVNPGYNFKWLFNKWGLSYGGFWGLRINSIFPEPTHLATCLSPAFFVSLYSIIIRQEFFVSRFKSIIIIIAYLVSFSGVGQIGIFLALLFLAINFGFIRYIIVFIPLAILLFNFLYANVPEFTERFDGLVALYSGEEYRIGEIHGSSFILFNNYTVAVENFLSNPLFGNGLGSHFIAFQKYSLAKDVLVAGINSNGQDANSMFLRLMSETGLFGLIIFFVIMIKCYVKRDANNVTNHWLISNGILIMILLNLFRQGHYFLNGFPFFVMLYYYNKISYNEFLSAKEQETEVTTDRELQAIT